MAAKKPTKLYIYGKHSVAEALRHAPRAVRALYLEEPGDKTLYELAVKAGIKPVPLDLRRVTSMVEGTAAHQGAVALIGATELLQDAGRFMESYAPKEGSILVFLSEVQDPHNVGAIIRSAAAFGAAAVLWPTHKQSPITAAVIRASAGMAFQIPLVGVPNPQQTIAALKKKGVRVLGLAADGKVVLEQEPFEAPTMLVLGNEAQGIAPYARALCDDMLSIDIEPKAESLNVAASAAVALYAARLRRRA
ncbi:MAG: 23S rRNA (guanosine(2251)-2'-O)-methyltransferase RlmB [Candidatus Pacebacteria bacterium]|nr:23S rRNA (guanosine(2251)-2'-O)-methyltransferase RlmB [Candidatus Paceibacterota bacterium]